MIKLYQILSLANPKGIELNLEERRTLKKDYGLRAFGFRTNLMGEHKISMSMGFPF